MFHEVIKCHLLYAAPKSAHGMMRDQYAFGFYGWRCSPSALFVLMFPYLFADIDSIVYVCFCDALPPSHLSYPGLSARTASLAVYTHAFLLQHMRESVTFQCV